MKKQLCAVALLTTTALSATAQADDFTYLSGGAVFNKQGYLADKNKRIDASKILSDDQKKEIKTSASGAGLYLNGSVGFENNVFVEGRLQNSRQLSKYLLGVGYHYPVMQQVDVYGLVGLSKHHLESAKHLVREYTTSDPLILPNYKSISTIFQDNIEPTAESAQHLVREYTTSDPLILPNYKSISTIFQDNIKLTAEVGVKARLNDLAGVQVAYRFSQFGGKKSAAEKQSLHEGRVVGYYKVTDTLALEAGYTYNSYAKLKVKDHTGQIGLRYTF